MTAIRFVYIYCSQLDLQGNWIKYYSQIRGVFNDSLVLGEKMKEDFEQVYQAQFKENRQCQAELKITARRRVSKCNIEHSKKDTC